ncbi:hypothetical protein BCV70DRAFT_76521 [Testicularia cyperi]|uniref:C2H2-type domain-containing protein n=1 Tax=Testicularia cyperi TaxID=1882483 RepID=A0A317XW77_9BASI|nr:hypothetical protein BCV70DRAFT_76521 [Testicularia cyperi]
MHGQDHHEPLSQNSLGLLQGLQSSPYSSSPYCSSPSSHPMPAPVTMAHTYTAPAYSFAASSMSESCFMARRGSVSSASSSCLSVGQVSDRSGPHESYSPRSFTPNESPLAIPGNLSTLSGLAIGTPDAENHQDFGSYVEPSSFQPDQHNALLALSHGHDEMAFQMPPPAHSKRRAIQSFDVAMLSSQSKSELDSDGSEEATPMPASTGTFVGHASMNLSESFRAAQVPVTPHSTVSRASFGPGPTCNVTPGHSFSPTSTPESPFNLSSSVSLRRFDSTDSFAGDMSGAYDNQAPHSATPPMLSLSHLHGTLKKEPSFQPNLAFRDHFQSPAAFQPHRASLPDMSPGGMASLTPSSSAAMGRTMSTPVPHLTRSSTSSEASSMGSFPSTPSSSIASSHDARGKSGLFYPSTPAQGLMSPGFDPYYSAPSVTGHRSNSMASLGSPIEDVSFSSLLDGRSRSFSASVARNTPRSRTRNAGPPPLIVSSADKLHVCHCGKRFKRMEHLKRHNRTHTQERPHKCPVETCGKFFGRSDNLAQHLKTHFRPAGLVGRSSELLSLTTGTDKFQTSEPRHDPHAAAAAAAAAAAQAAASINSKRGSVSQSCLGGPIALSKPMAPRQVLAPAGGISANSSPIMPTTGSGLQMSSYFA